MDFHETHEKRRGEDLFGLLVLVASVLLFWQSYRIAGFTALSSPGAFPLAASAVMVIAAVVVVIGNLRRRGRLSGEAVMPATIALFIGLVVAYAVALVPLGFILASFAFLTLATKLLYKAGWGRCIGLAAVSLVVIYVVFRLVFQVVLPEGIVPEREWMAALGSLFGGGEVQQ